MIGDYRHLVTIELPAAPVANGDGGFTESWAPATPPTWFCAIDAAPTDMERAGLGTVTTMATHVIRGRYRADLSTAARVVLNGRVFAILGVRNPQERSITLELTAAEVV